MFILGTHDITFALMVDCVAGEPALVIHANTESYTSISAIFEIETQHKYNSCYTAFIYLVYPNTPPHTPSTPTISSEYPQPPHWS